VQVLKLIVAPTRADGTTADGSRFEFVRIFGTVLATAGGLKTPRGVTMRRVGDRETVIVVDYGNNRLAEFELDGTYVRELGVSRDEGRARRLLSPSGVAYTPSHPELGEGNELRVFQLKDPRDVTMLPGDRVAVADDGNHCVSIIDGESGDVVARIGGSDSETPLRDPCAITSDSQGNLLVLEYETDFLHAFTAEGESVCTRLDLGMANNGFKSLAWSNEGNLAITESDTNTLREWRSTD
jgi:hypothetical protein